MGITKNSIDDGEGRYASRTRVNRIVYEWEQSDLAGNEMAMAQLPGLNGEIHTIYLDVSSSKLDSNTDADTVKGSLTIQAPLLTVAGLPMNLCNPITSLDFTNKAAGRVYTFQTTEGSQQGTMDHALSVSPGLSGHSSPAAPKVANAAGTATVIGANQAWTGRVAGGMVVMLSISGGTVWAADTGAIRLIIHYS